MAHSFCYFTWLIHNPAAFRSPEPKNALTVHVSVGSAKRRKVGACSAKCSEGVQAAAQSDSWQLSDEVVEVEPWRENLKQD